MSTDGKIPQKVLRPVWIQLLTVLLLPVIGLMAIDLQIIHPLLSNNHVNAKMAIALVIVPKLIVLPWIGLNTLRFTEDHFNKFGISIIKTNLFACLFLAVLAISVSAIDSIQSIIFSQNSKADSGKSRAPDYHLSTDMVKKEYYIDGIIDFGISRDFLSLLEQHPGGIRVVLSSHGGSIFEGRGLAVLIQNHNLDTHVDDECSSACTLAFIGGQRRTLGTSAKLGFHQYSMDYLNRHQALPFHDPVKEQAHDGELMLNRGINKEFVDRIGKLHQDIWYPDAASLLHFGVIHAVR